MGLTFLLLSRQIQLQPHHRGVSVNTIHLSLSLVLPSRPPLLLPSFLPGCQGSISAPFSRGVMGRCQCVCVRVLMWGCVLSLGIMSDRGERPIWVELLCLVPGHLSLAISVLPANRSQVVRSAYHEDQRLSVSPSLPLLLSLRLAFRRSVRGSACESVCVFV